MKKSSPLYIVGVGRSGTSLLQSILGTHSKIKAIPETSVLRRVIFENNSIDLQSDRFLARIPSFSSKIMASDKDQRHILDAYIDMLSNEGEYKYVLDKDPRLIEYCPLINKFLEKAKIIHIYRDPRDVLASKKKAKWSAGRHLTSYLIASKIQLTDGMKIENMSNVISVKYEDLITATEFEIRRICVFLGISFQIEMLEFTGTSKLLMHDDESSWKKEILDPVNANNFNNWLDALSGIEALASFLNVRNFCIRNGYLRTKNYSVYEWLISIVLSAFSSFGSTVYSRFRSYRFSKIERQIGGN